VKLAFSICCRALLVVLACSQPLSIALSDSRATNEAAKQSKPIRVLLLGDKGHHRPADFAGRVVPGLAKVGIQVDYTEDVDILSNKTGKLDEYDCVALFANIDKISPEQEQGLLAYVESGHGFVPIHCASFCFRNSDRFVQLVGAQFKQHGAEVFTTKIVLPEHPVMVGHGSFESWDETYTHDRHNTENRTVLEVRVAGAHAKGVTEEPWTWVREQGKGRVFYTAWGHDERTWNQPGFHNLLERGIRWAANAPLKDVKPFVNAAAFPEQKMTSVAKDLHAFTYTEVGAQIPNYTPNKKWGVQDAPLTTMQDPLPGVESLKHYVTPQGFAMKLWASESEPIAAPVPKVLHDKAGAGLVGKPIAMSWDERGRLWVCETIDYPNELQDAGKGRDRIRICEDTDGDMVADKFTIFASGFSIPTSIVHFRGGAIIQDGIKTVYSKDIDGDDQADFRQELITGWALGDTHGGVSNFQWGIDNWIYAMQGYNASKPVINGVTQQAFRQGFWRFAVESGKSDETAPAFAVTAPETAVSKFDDHTIRVSKLEFLRSTNNNTWGLGISEEGLIFGSTANGNPSDFMPISNSYYERVKGWSPETLKMISDNDRFAPITNAVRQVDHHGGYTAAAGHALYTARKYPKPWWNRTAFVCEPTGHLVGAFVLSRDGANYRSTSPFNLVASDDEWASPIMAEVGPDGNMWVLDWYNYIVQHNPTPNGFSTGKGNAYESSLRDKKHGRVYRVEYQGNEGTRDSDFDLRIARSGLANADTATLVKALRHGNFLWRKNAQRLLVEKFTNLTKSATETAEASTLIQNLYSLIQDQSADEIGINPGAVHAIWTLAGLQHSNQNTKDVLVGALRHPSPAVRRAAIQVLSAESADLDKLLASDMLSDSDDQVKLAAILKIADAKSISGSVVDKLVSMNDLGGDKVLLDAWTSAAAVHASQTLPRILGATNVAFNGSYLARITIIAEHFARSLPSAESVAMLVRGGTNTETQSAILAGLEKGWPKSHTVQLDSETQNEVVKKWLDGPTTIDSKSRLLQLATYWGVQGLAGTRDKLASQLIDGIRDNSLTVKERLSAASQFVSLQRDSDDAVKQLLGLINPQLQPEMAQGIIATLRDSRANGLAEIILSQSNSYTPELRGHVVRLLLSRPETTRSLLAAIQAGQVALSDIQLDQRQALREHPDPEIRKIAVATMKATGGVVNADRQKVLDAWMSITASQGSATAGKAVFLKHCSLCHIHGDIGVQIGPNLTGMAVHPKAEMLTNILDPSRSVEGNFRTYSVLTTDGVVLTGMLAGESKTSVELINTQGKRETVLREDIEQLTASSKSLMPEGFESQMSRSEMTDLLEFLSSKGKYLPLSIESVATASSGRGLFTKETSSGERMIFDDWSPKMVGEIPFLVVDPMAGVKPNIVMLRGPKNSITATLPTEVEMVCNARVAAVHLLSGVGGWSYPAIKEKSVSMIVRLVYSDGQTEDHPMLNGVHMADYIRKVDVPDSTFAFELNNGHQVRTIKIKPKRDVALSSLKLIKGADETAPIVMAVTIESP
jgi:uncharacterized protein